MSVTIYNGCDNDAIEQLNPISTNFLYMIVTLLVFRTMGLCGTERTRSWRDQSASLLRDSSLKAVSIAFTHIISKMNILSAVFGYNSDFTNWWLYPSIQNLCWTLVSFHLIVISPRYEYGSKNKTIYNVCPAASSPLAKALASIDKE